MKTGISLNERKTGISLSESISISERKTGISLSERKMFISQ
jgi:hypothetical protein